MSTRADSFYSSNTMKKLEKIIDTIDLATQPNIFDRCEKWREKNIHSKLVEHFDHVVEHLNALENRLCANKCDGYYRRYRACHKHITKNLAVFYRYDKSSQLQIVDVKKHYGRKNQWRSA